jgi:TatD DNase family protein
MNTKNKNAPANQNPPKQGGFNPLGAVFGAVGSVAREVAGISNAVRADLANVPPPKLDAPHITQLSSEIERTLKAASGGLGEVTLNPLYAEAVPEPASPEYHEPTPKGPVKLSPIDVLADPAKRGQFTLDCYFHAYAREDVTGYPKIISAEAKPPFTFGILAADASKEVLKTAVLEAINSHGRLFGAVGMGPRDVWDNLDELDTTLTDILNANPRILAVGPIGLDANYDAATLSKQQAQLARQLDIAADFDLPTLIFHRKAPQALAEVLDAQKNKPRLVYIKAPESMAEVTMLQRHNAQLLLRSELTDPALNIYRAVVREWDKSALLLASGSALIAPHTMAGQFNTPDGLKHTLAEAAQILNLPVPEARVLFNTNALRVFFKNLLPV